MVKVKVAKTGKKKIALVPQSKQEDDNVVVLPPVRMSDDPAPRQVRKFKSTLSTEVVVNIILIY